MKYYYRSYMEDGQINVNKTLQYINEYYTENFGKELTQLPDDDFLFL